MNKPIINALKGFSMGAGVFPGVSAGTIALVTGIFQPLIDSLAAILSFSNWKMLFKGDAKGFWKAINGSFLLPVGLGTVVGFVVLARLVKWALDYYPIPAWSFFFGLILVSTVWLLARMKKWRLVDFLWLIIGAGVGVALCLVNHPDQSNPNTALWYTALSGALAVCSMILPGIAGSFILVMMGNFNYMLGVLNNLQWTPLLVFLVGCVIGIVLFSKFLHWLLEKHERPTMLVLFGFVLGFLPAIWPWADRAAIGAAQLLRTGAASPLDLQIPWAVGFFLLGVALVVLLEVFTAKPSAKNE